MLNRDKPSKQTNIPKKTHSKKSPQVKAAPATPLSMSDPYRLLVEETKDYAMFLMDPQRRIHHWNRGAELIFGYSKKEMIGQLADVIFTPEDCKAKVPLKEVGTAKRIGRAADMRWHLRKDGSRFWANGVMTCLRDDDGTLQGFAKIARDATKEREADDALREAHAELDRRVTLRTAELQKANENLRQESVQRRHLEEARQKLMERIVTTQEEERRRIARELHDQMGQQLAALMIGLKTVGVVSTKAQNDAATRIAALESLVGELIEQAHDLAWELRPPTLDNLGLEAAIRQYAQDWAEKNNVELDFVSQGMKGSRPSQSLETTLYRIVQEALTNVQRHAKAKKVSILLEKVRKEIVIIVEDNGIGFELTPKDSKAPKVVGSSKRLGLLGMQERMELVGGTFTIESALGLGTTIYARSPLETRNTPKKG